MITEPDAIDPAEADDDTPTPASTVSPLTPAVGYIIGWIQHEIDSVPDQNGVTSKVRVHTLGLIPVATPASN